MSNGCTTRLSRGLMSKLSPVYPRLSPKHPHVVCAQIALFLLLSAPKATGDSEGSRTYPTLGYCQTISARGGNAHQPFHELLRVEQSAAYSGMAVQTLARPCHPMQLWLRGGGRKEKKTETEENVLPQEAARMGDIELKAKGQKRQARKCKSHDASAAGTSPLKHDSQTGKNQDPRPTGDAEAEEDAGIEQGLSLLASPTKLLSRAASSLLGDAGGRAMKQTCGKASASDAHANAAQPAALPETSAARDARETRWRSVAKKSKAKQSATATTAAQQQQSKTQQRKTPVKSKLPAPNTSVSQTSGDAAQSQQQTKSWQMKTTVNSELPATHTHTHTHTDSPNPQHQQQQQPNKTRQRKTPAKSKTPTTSESPAISPTDSPAMYPAQNRRQRKTRVKCESPAISPTDLPPFPTLAASARGEEEDDRELCDTLASGLRLMDGTCLSVCPLEQGPLMFALPSVSCPPPAARESPLDATPRWQRAGEAAAAASRPETDIICASCVKPLCVCGLKAYVTLPSRPMEQVSGGSGLARLKQGLAGFCSGPSPELLEALREEGEAGRWNSSDVTESKSNWRPYSDLWLPGHETFKYYRNGSFSGEKMDEATRAKWARIANIYAPTLAGVAQIFIDDRAARSGTLDYSIITDRPDTALDPLLKSTYWYTPESGYVSLWRDGLFPEENIPIDEEGQPLGDPWQIDGEREERGGRAEGGQVMQANGLAQEEAAGGGRGAGGLKVRGSFESKQTATSLQRRREALPAANQAVDMMKRMFKGMLKEGDRVLPPRIHPGVLLLMVLQSSWLEKQEDGVTAEMIYEWLLTKNAEFALWPQPAWASVGVDFDVVAKARAAGFFLACTDRWKHETSGASRGGALVQTKVIDRCMDAGDVRVSDAGGSLRYWERTFNE